MWAGWWGRGADADACWRKGESRSPKSWWHNTQPSRSVHMNCFPKGCRKLIVFAHKTGPLGFVTVLNIVEAIFCKYRSIRGYEKKSGSKILFFSWRNLDFKIWTWHFFGVYLLREALFPSVGTRNLLSVLRPVPCSVRKIIDFCEGDMEGASPLLSTGSLSTFDFEGSKSEHLSKSLRAGIGRFRDPFSDPHFGTFWQHVKKWWSWLGTDSVPADWLFRAWISNWRCDVRDTFIRVQSL